MSNGRRVLFFPYLAKRFVRFRAESNVYRLAVRVKSVFQLFRAGSG